MTDRQRVVCAHGFTQTGASWGPVATRLAGEFELVCPDAPGHGNSAALDSDLWGAADLLVATGGRATYLGYSMGARTALHAALAHPGQVQRLILLGVNPGIRNSAERAARRDDDERLAQSIEHDGVEAFLARWLEL